MARMWGYYSEMQHSSGICFPLKLEGGFAWKARAQNHRQLSMKYGPLRGLLALVISLSVP